MKNIILAQIKMGSNEPPLGLLYVANALEKEGYVIKICYFEPNQLNKIENLVKELNPLFFGLSISTSPYLKFAIKISKLIKKNHRELPIVWGGVHPTLFPKECLEKSYVDIVCIGEGEKTIVEVAKRLEEKKELNKIKNIGFKNGKQIVITESAPFYKNLDEYKPSWHLINLEKHFIKKWGKRVLPIITSRGCPFECAFCWNLSFYKKLWRGHSAKAVIKEIQFLKKKYKIEGVDFIDSYFFTDKKRAYDIIKNIKIDWGADIRACDINDGVMKTFKENGCKTIFIGAESGSQRILDIMRKHIEIRDIINAAKLCDKYGILGIFSFMVGVPGETMGDIYKTINLITKLKKEFKSIEIDGPKVYTPYPGTEYYEKVIKMGFKPPKNLESWAKFTRSKCQLPWIKNKALIESLQYVCYAVYSNPRSIIGKIIKKFEKLRWKKKIFCLPLETKIISFIYNNSKIKKVFSKIYRNKRGA